jgi:dTDP-4-dehydrorhamnose reductase
LTTSNELGFKLDVTNEEGLTSLVHQIKPDLIINTTALHNIDYCETHPQEAFSVNTKVVATTAALCSNIGARLVHFSTDFVFDGKKNSPYNESDKLNQCLWKEQVRRRTPC